MSQAPTSSEQLRHAGWPAHAAGAALALLLLSSAQPANTQTSPAQGPLHAAAHLPTADDPQLADYLGLLRQISPAAEGGARTYLAALRLRCGRSLDAAGLRRAMAQDGGDAVLMALIRAEATQDRKARQRLVAELSCANGAQP